MVKGFDFIAPVYDRLARLVFGRSIVDSQVWFLANVPDNASVLILGGGTGWLLEELIKIKPFCSICYIEASPKMIKLTHQRKLIERTSLILGTEDDIPHAKKFDVIITNFYLDLFPEGKLEKVIQKINRHVTSSSIWIATDFLKTNVWWQRALLKIMYVFFRQATDIEATQLMDWNKKLADNHWIERNSRFWSRGFIKGVLLRQG